MSAIAADPVIPITYDRTKYSGVMASPVVGKGRIQVENFTQTVYPNGLTVTRIHHNEIEVYDNKAVISRHNLPQQLDQMA